MKKSIWQIIISQRIWIFFVIISGLLWYLNRLNRRFTSEIPVDIEIVDDYNSKVWIKNREMTYLINCEADGRLLVLANAGLLPRIKIYSSALKFVTKDNYVKFIDPNSLKHAIQQKFNTVNVNYVIDSLNELVVSSLTEKKIAIKSNVSVVCKRQHMFVGKLKMSFDSVMVKGPEIIMDTLKYIYTKPYLKEGLTSDIQGLVDLIAPEDVMLQKDEVGFRAEVAAFTEVEMSLPIDVINAPYNTEVLVVPSVTHVVVRVPLDIYKKQIELSAHIDLSKSRSSDMFEVLIDSLPFGAQLMVIDPQFVEPFIQKTDD